MPINKEKNVSFTITWSKAAHKSLEKVIEIHRQSGIHVNKSKFLLGLFIDWLNYQALMTKENKEEK